MKIPFKIRLFDKFVKTPKYIIIHDVSCISSDLSKTKLDNANPQTNDLRIHQYTKSMYPDLNYHFIIERIKQDYEVILGRPFAVHCDYDDIKNPFNFAFHICIMGNYNYDIPSRRLYQKLSYNVISPLMRMYRIGPNRIFTHNELSTSKVVCPGEFFDKQRLISYVKTMRIV